MRNLLVGIGMLGWLVACAPRAVEPRSPQPAACDDGKGPSCLELADRYDHGKGVEKSTAKALELYVLACQHDVARACSAAGDISVSGDGVPMEEAKGLALREKACL